MVEKKSNLYIVPVSPLLPPYFTQHVVYVLATTSCPQDVLHLRPMSSKVDYDLNIFCGLSIFCLQYPLIREVVKKALASLGLSMMINDIRS